MSDEKDTTALVENAKAFLRCGGSITWKEWTNTDVQDKALLIEAAEQLDIERATLLAVALRSEAGAELVFSRIDAGDALVRGSLMRKLGEVISRRGS